MNMNLIHNCNYNIFQYEIFILFYYFIYQQWKKLTKPLFEILAAFKIIK